MPWFGDGLKWQGFIHSDGASNITLAGGGVVDGNGAPWWACGCNGNPAPPAPPTNASGPCGYDGVAYERPKLVHLVNGSDVVIANLTFRDSPMWHLRPSWITRLHVYNVTVVAPPNPISCNTGACAGPAGGAPGPGGWFARRVPWPLGAGFARGLSVPALTRMRPP
jgi:polygalacturonase